MNIYFLVSIDFSVCESVCGLFLGEFFVILFAMLLPVKSSVASAFFLKQF